MLLGNTLMYMRVFFTVLLIILHSIPGVSQKGAKPLPRISGDCRNAVTIAISQSCKYGPTEAPRSFGNVQEIVTSDKNSEVSFTQEHNSAWYLLIIKYDGELTFDVIPTDSMDDYDFLLYPYRDSSLCRGIINKTTRPIRSNMACNCRPADKGVTGLSIGVTQEFRRQGKGNPFSKPIQVKKGEKYMLVLDNINPKGKGHTIYFHSIVNVEIKGRVIGADSLPLVADILLADTKGKTIKQTTSDSKGNYTINTGIEKNAPYSLIFSNDSSFIGTKTINTANTKDGHTFPNIKTILPKLKKGAKYALGNINFYGNSVEFMPESYPSVEALTRLMKKNKRMRIQIEGHVNGAGNDKEAKNLKIYFQELSEGRANMLRTCLINAGIAGDRMTTIGYGANQMLFPYAKNEDEQKANRRVEIKVISVRGE